MEYKNIEEFETALKSGELDDLPDSVVIENVQYDLQDSSKHSFLDTFKSTQKPMIIYRVNRKESNMERYNKVHENADSPGHQDHMIILWEMIRMQLHPVAVKFVAGQRMGSAMVREAAKKDNSVIGHKMPIILSGFNGDRPIKAKVDTGAEMCSLDANNLEWEPGNTTVKFEFGDRVVSMGCDSVGIRTADGGIEYRPVVVFDVRIPDGDDNPDNDTEIKKVQFNLNDRSDMPDKILLGKNFISAGNFKVMIKNPMGKEIENEDVEYDWDALQEIFKDIETPVFENVSISSKVQKAIDILNQIK